MTVDLLILLSMIMLYLGFMILLVQIDRCNNNVAL